MNLSHNVYNPNNLNIDTNEYHVIPFGHRCASALALKFASLRKFSLPFDWTTPSFPICIKNVLINNFEDFIPDVHNNIFTNKYNIRLVHFNSNIEEGIAEYKRRIERFYKVIKEGKKIYFIYVNEDYLYNAEYRKPEFNDDIFSQMVDLDSYLKKTYDNIDFTILYFNFVKHKVPIDSNIINFVLHTEKIWNSNNGCPYEDFRRYCGKVLSDIFETHFVPEYSRSDFIG